MAIPLRSIVATVFAAALALVAPPAAAQSTSGPAQLDTLLGRVGDYMQVFVTQLTNVVAEEQYQQRFRQAAPQRRLKSDFLLVRYPGEEHLFLAFRDVLEVDGRPVRDQQERVLKLFTEPYQDAIRRAAEIEREGARHSIARGRVVNPLELMTYLQTPYQRNFTFALRGWEPSLGSDVREIEMSQAVEPGTRQVPLRGKAWVAQASGRVVKTEMLAGIGANVRVTTTTFGRDPGLRIDVPLEMRDTFPSTASDEFQGVARYSNFRRFTVRAEQELDLPDQSK